MDEDSQVNDIIRILRENNNRWMSARELYKLRKVKYGSGNGILGNIRIIVRYTGQLRDIFEKKKGNPFKYRLTNQYYEPKKKSSNQLLSSPNIDRRDSSVISASGTTTNESNFAEVEYLLERIAHDLSVSSETREKVQVELNRRNPKFREGILRAYNHSCAICDKQLDLVEAAHIVPFSKEEQADLTNGIALCTEHHAAYDKKLIYIDTDYHVRLNGKTEDDLDSRFLTGGLKTFKNNARIGQKVNLPREESYWPNKNYIEQRMKLDGL
jgi:hypothetical protein